MSKRSQAWAARQRAATTASSSNPSLNLPLGAMAAGVGLSLLAGTALAQAPAAQTTEQSLPTVTVKEKAEKRPEAKDNYQAVTTTIGKGKQALRDIPQSVTVVTEKLMDDRHQDTMKEALKNTAGVTFVAAEGGEEDIRLRGFSLANAGDIFIDGMRDPAFYDRDNFNSDRIELLRGSASMLFGRGSTGGAVNQVSKAPYLGTSTEINATVGRYDYKRVTGDVNIKTADTQAFRINAMKTMADNNGAGSKLDKEGLAGSYTWGLGTRDQVTLSAFHLENNNGINYGLPWIRGNRFDQGTSQILPNGNAADYYGLASDRNKGSADIYSLSHVSRVSADTEIKNTIRRGFFTRDQRASTIRIPNSGTGTPPNYGTEAFSSSSVFNRNPNNKIQDFNILQLQSDISTKFQALGFKHEALFGSDYSLEKKSVYGASSAPGKPATTAGNPDDGVSVNEAARTLSDTNSFRSAAVGVYGQDVIQLTPQWKVVGGLRYDMMRGRYKQNNASGTGATRILAGDVYTQGIYKWSKRVGMLFQPTALHSFHFSYGTSFNTSGDTYSYNRLSAKTEPESSRNIEFGAKLDSADGDLSTRLALFHSTKYKERNTDAPSATGDGYLLSGKRHSAGFELDVTGRITPQWEIYLSYMYMPIANVDEGSSSAGGSRKGDRPGLTPKHSGTVWNTYTITSQIRVGAGINFRSKQSPADIGTPANGVWTAPGFATVDLMAEYGFNKQYSLKMNVTNVGDKYYGDSLYRGHYIPGMGRNVQVSLNAKF